MSERQRFYCMNCGHRFEAEALTTEERRDAQRLNRRLFHWPARYAIGQMCVAVGINGERRSRAENCPQLQRERSDYFGTCIVTLEQAFRLAKTRNLSRTAHEPHHRRRHLRFTRFHSRADRFDPNSI
jgi:hypothetical protein